MNPAPALYLITDRLLVERVGGARTLPQVLEAALAAVDPRRTAVQLREKDLPARGLLELGRAVDAICRRRGVSLLINDRLDVALALGAGVHLGGGSLAAEEVRQLVGPGIRIGVSCHGVLELKQRRAGADFAVWGPVFPTPSKAQYGAPLGFADLEAATALGLPLLALGGITRATAGQLRPRGFAGVACISEVFGAQEPGEAASGLLAAFDAGPVSGPRVDSRVRP